LYLLRNTKYFKRVLLYQLPDTILCYCIWQLIQSIYFFCIVSQYQYNIDTSPHVSVVLMWKIDDGGQRQRFMITIMRLENVVQIGAKQAKKCLESSESTFFFLSGLGDDALSNLKRAIWLNTLDKPLVRAYTTFDCFCCKTPSITAACVRCCREASLHACRSPWASKIVLC
jgi:hypothetical protein